MRKSTSFLKITIALLALSGLAAADSLAVLVNTQGLQFNPAQPFTLAFYLNNGGGVDDGNTTVNISGLNAGGGSFGLATLTGTSVSGDANTGIALSDAGDAPLFEQVFTPGSLLSFTLNFNGGVDAGAPDLFGFLIEELHTTDPTQSDNLLTLQFDSAHPGPSLYTATTFVNGGNAVLGVTPVITPEPASMVLLASGVGLIVARRRKLRV
jgi:hypothetical protein